MLNGVIRAALGGSVILSLSLFLGTCQDYSFEELPRSIVEEGHDTIIIPAATDIDILFVIDNSGSMVGEQKQLAASFSSFTAVLDEKFGAGRYRIAVVTTGMESLGCPPCDPLITTSCMNETGENGRFQDRRGSIVDESVDPPIFAFEPSDPACRVVTSANLACFVDPAGGGLYGSGTVFVGTNGCGYEKGLAPIRLALSGGAVGGGADFPRPDAMLAVIVVSDEEDCGEVGDVTEGLSGLGGKVCYYASKGVGPDGAESDPQGKPYELTSVQETYDFLMGLKGNRVGMVKFVAVVGVEDEANPDTTEIRYEDGTATSAISPACLTPGCTSTGDSCKAFPGTRYLELAEEFTLEENGLVGSICQSDFSALMTRIANFVTCPRDFKLSRPIADPALVNILINGVEVPRYSCDVTGRVESCAGPGAACSEGTCLPTWTRRLPGDPLNPFTAAKAPGGCISFADHYQPCELMAGGEIRFEVVYVVDR